MVEFKRADWQESAACRGMDPAIFYVKRGDAGNSAKAVCAGCPVAGPCRQYAVDNGERYGIWGGRSADTHLRDVNLDWPQRQTRDAPIVHGTVAGRSMHLRRGVPMCQYCQNAWNAYRRQHRARRSA